MLDDRVPVSWSSSLMQEVVVSVHPHLHRGLIVRDNCTDLLRVLVVSLVFSILQAIKFWNKVEADLHGSRVYLKICQF